MKLGKVCLRYQQPRERLKALVSPRSIPTAVMNRTGINSWNQDAHLESFDPK